MVSPPVLSQKVEDKHVDLLQLILIRLSEKVHNFGYVVHDAPSEPHDSVAINRLYRTIVLYYIRRFDKILRIFSIY
jgi:hypothetical protein